MVNTNENNSYRRGQELLDQGLYKDAIEQFDHLLMNSLILGKH